MPEAALRAASVSLRRMARMILESMMLVTLRPVNAKNTWFMIALLMINAATTSAISSFAGNRRNRAAKIVAAKRSPMQNRIVQGSGGADTVVTSDQIPYASTTSATVNSRLELPLADGKCIVCRLIHELR